MRCLLIGIVVTLSGCHIGHPAPVAAYQPGPVTAAAAEPGLDEALRRHLTAALAQRAALGEGSLVGVTVLSADSGLSGSSSGQTLHAVRLTLRVTLAGPTPREIVLSGQRAYRGDAPLAAGMARAEAFDALAAELMTDAADWLLLSGVP